MREWLDVLLSSEWMPHGYCLQWEPRLVGLHVTSDALITAAYYSIPVSLLIVRGRRRDFPFPGLLALFALFIFACGTTHLMEIWTLWRADYGLEGLIKAATAAASIATAIVLVPILPRILALRSPAELEAANWRLSAEVEERRRAEHRLELRTRELMRSNDSLQDFAYVASHDLREPLRKIQAFGKRLEQDGEEALSDRGRDYVQRMTAAAERMDGLLAALLDYSRVTTRPSPFETLSLDQSLDEALEDLEASVEASGARIERQSLPEAEADASQLRQVFQNLLSNALKFHRPDTAPVIRIGPGPAPEPGWISVVVADEGIGFEQRHAARIFDIFQRLHGRSEFEGAGVGLTICRKIIERHGGRLQAQGRPGEGAVFTIEMPARQPNFNVPPLAPATAFAVKSSAPVGEAS